MVTEKPIMKSMELFSVYAKIGFDIIYQINEKNYKFKICNIFNFQAISKVRWKILYCFDLNFLHTLKQKRREMKLKF